MINQYAYARDIYDEETGQWYEPEVSEWTYFDPVALCKHLREWMRANASSYRHAEKLTGIDHCTLWRVANWHGCEWATCRNITRAIELDGASYAAIYGSEIGKAFHQHDNGLRKVMVL